MRIVPLIQKFYLTKGNRDELLERLQAQPMALESGAFKGTQFQATAHGEDTIRVTMLHKTGKSNSGGLTQARLHVKTGVAGTQAKLSLGIPLLLLVAFGLAFLAEVTVLIFFYFQGASEILNLIAPIISISFLLMMGVLFLTFRGVSRRLIPLLVQRLNLQPDNSPYKP